MERQPPTSIHIPSYLPYPLTITRLLVQADTVISRGTAICDYSFEYTFPQERPISPDQPLPPRRKETRYGTWECPIEGVLRQWLVRPGQTITQQESAKNPAVMVQEDCTHNMQIHGMCALCGKDMTVSDYLGFSDSLRASIRLTHDANGPTVSMEEALRYDKDRAQRLLQDRRLSLIVDLDQTIVHATVDPTVGEWIEDAERFEAKQKVKLERTTGDTSRTPEAMVGNNNSDGDDDEVNPNWEALKDVKKFKLGGEGQTWRNRGKPVTEDGGCYYYIKPRPGLPNFLARIKAMYEMHVYTMGTRAYALEVCKTIDPDGSVFGERVLTRDESGSMTVKNLQRLFPSDQSMVVVIDDRSDVWSDVPNLVKVIPYDFFVGIGDINSAHLPKPPDPTVPPSPLAINPAASRSPPSSPLSPSTVASLSDTTALSPSSGSDLNQPSPDVEAAEEAATATNDATNRVLSRAQSKVIEAVVEERPLAKMQERLDHENDAEETYGSNPAWKENDGRDKDALSTSENGAENGSGGAVATKPKPKTRHKMLLHNVDQELGRIGAILTEIHRRFYEAYVFTQNEERGRAPAHRDFDVRNFIQAIKSQTFSGLHFTFSNVFPVNVDPREHPIWRQAQQFGATCYSTWTESITHVIAMKLRSEKTDRGEQKPGAHVVHPQWLWDCVSQWQRIPEAPYEAMLRAMYLGDAQPPAGPSQPVTASIPPTSDPIDAGGASLSLSTPGPSIETVARPSSAPGFSSLSSSGEVEGDELFVSDDKGVHSNGAGVDWAAVDEEVDAFLNESGDEDVDDYEGASDSSLRSDASVLSRQPSYSRKRPRSSSTSADDRGTAISPLAKRLKVSENRRGRSGLKVEVYKHGVSESDDGGTGMNSPGRSADDDDGGDDDDDDDDADSLDRRAEEEAEDEEGDLGSASDDEEDEEEDFLARDLADSWG